MLKKGEVTVVEIQHDSWCKTLKTGSGLDCNCDADIHSEDQEFMAMVNAALRNGEKDE